MLRFKVDDNKNEWFKECAYLFCESYDPSLLPIFSSPNFILGALVPWRLLRQTFDIFWKRALCLSQFLWYTGNLAWDPQLNPVFKVDFGSLNLSTLWRPSLHVSLLQHCSVTMTYIWSMFLSCFARRARGKLIVNTLLTTIMFHCSRYLYLSIPASYSRPAWERKWDLIATCNVQNTGLSLSIGLISDFSVHLRWLQNTGMRSRNSFQLRRSHYLHSQILRFPGKLQLNFSWYSPTKQFSVWFQQPFPLVFTSIVLRSIIFSPAWSNCLNSMKISLAWFFSCRTRHYH